MKILLINHYAGSPEMGMEYRPYYLSREWIKMGHEVSILAANHSHIRANNPEIKIDFEEQNIDGIRYIWVKTPAYEGSGTGRVKNILAFVRKTFYKANYLVNRYMPDVVIASSTYTSDNYVARKISKLSRAKYIYEVHDLWPLSPIELGGFSKYHPFIIAMQHGENFAYKKADAVVSMLPKTKKYMETHGLDLKKWHYIPNGIVIKDWEKSIEIPEQDQTLIENIKQENKLIVGYAGSHSISNSLSTLVETARLLKENEEISFILVGDGPEKPNLINQAKNLKNIHFLNPIPKTAIPNLLKEFDFLFIGWNRSPLYRFGISPNKIFDYMMAEKPIIHAVEAGNDLVKEANAGISIEPENPQAIADAILKLLNLSEDVRKIIGTNGRNYVLKNYNYSKLAVKFINILT